LINDEDSYFYNIMHPRIYQTNNNRFTIINSSELIFDVILNNGHNPIISYLGKGKDYTASGTLIHKVPKFLWKVFKQLQTKQ